MSSAIRCNVLRPVRTVGARRAGGAGGAARHADEVNYGRQVVRLVVMPVGHFMR